MFRVRRFWRTIFSLSSLCHQGGCYRLAWRLSGGAGRHRVPVCIQPEGRRNCSQ